MPVQLRLVELQDCNAATDSVSWCSAAESRRALAITSSPRRAQFLLGRWLARQMLCEHYGGAPDDWRLSCEFGCAPLVERGPTQVAVSLAHRFDTVVCGVSTTPIGIDIEIDRQRPIQDPDGRAKIMLAPAEASGYLHTPLPQRAALLRALWVLKEAWTKSLGLQLQLSLLAHICASPAAPHAANARTWTAGKLTLGLVCRDPAALAHVNVTDLAPNSASQDWLVEAV